MGKLKAKMQQFEKYIVPISLGVLLFLYLMCYMIPSVQKIFLFLIVLCAVALFCFLNFGNSFIFLICFSGGGINLNINQYVIPFNSILVALFVAIFGIKLLILFIKKEKKINWVSLSLALLLVVYGFIGFNKTEFFEIIENTVLIMLVFLTCYFIKDIDVKKVVLYYTHSVLIFIGTGLLLSLFNIGKDMLWMEGRFMAFSTNPNSLYALCLMSMAFLTALYFKKQISKSVFWVYNVILLIGGLLTMSKAFLICLCILIVMFFIFEFISNKKLALIELCVFVVAGLIFVLIFKDRIEILLDRFLNTSSENVLDSIFTGRIRIWRIYLTTWTSSPCKFIFGCGVSAPQPITLESHSSYIKFLYQYGLVGNLIIVANIVTMLILNRDKIKINWFACLAVVMFLLRSLVESFVGVKYIGLIILAFALFIECKQKDNNSRGEVCGKSENESFDK